MSKRRNPSGRRASPDLAVPDLVASGSPPPPAAVAPAVPHVLPEEQHETIGPQPPLPTVRLPLPELPARRRTWPEPPDGLVAALRQGECVLYAGAGLAAQAGLPTWQPLLEGLVSWLQAAGVLAASEARWMHGSLEQGFPDPVANALASVLASDPAPFISRARAVFTATTLPVPRTHLLLRQLPWAAVLTTNFDTLLDRTFRAAAASVCTPHDEATLPERLAQCTFFLMKLYGTLDQPASIVMAPAAFRELAALRPAFVAFMADLLASRTLLVLGASLDGLITDLGSLRLTAPPGRTHYALAAVGSGDWQVRALLLERRYGIKVLPYTPSPGHPELEAFLDHLVNRLPDDVGTVLPRTVVPLPAARACGQILRRVRLQHIGSWTDLTLDIGTGWTILVSDSALDVSPILRAIALGLRAEPGTACGNGIITPGETHATIELETDAGSCPIALQRTETGQTIVAFESSRPAGLGDRLVLGFPPVRQVRTGRPERARPNDRSRPNTDDVHSLVTNEADGRLGGLQQWLAANARAAGDPAVRGRFRGDHRDLPAFILNAVSRLTPGLEVALGTAHPDTGMLTLLSDRGEETFEMLRPSLLALVAWVGVLVQRLAEISPADTDPAGQSAVVLLDDLAAHVHPDWQATALRELPHLFPHVQWIASVRAGWVAPARFAGQVVHLSHEPTEGVVAHAG